MKTNPLPQSNVNSATLHMSLELANEEWKLGFLDQMGRRPRIKKILAGDLTALLAEISAAKKRFELPLDAPVISCYEAGRDGFWIHRCLLSAGIENLVIDASSIQVNRKKRQAKTDRIDAEKMVIALVRYQGGDRYALRAVRVPDREIEDARHLHRELRTLKTEKTAHTNRIGSLLKTQGIELTVDRHFLKNMEVLRTGDGIALGQGLRERLTREFERVQLAVEQIRTLQKQQAEMLRLAAREDANADRVAKRAHQLLLLCGIGPVTSWTLSAEIFSWRDIMNRRQLGALAGLVPTPFASGSQEREQGISKSGRGDIRVLMIEIAWGWLKWQPQSDLAKWFHRRFADNKRSRKRGIVALARKLLVALGLFVRTGALPDGAKLKENELEFNYTPSLVPS